MRCAIGCGLNSIDCARDDGGERRDSRVTRDGLIDQLTAMLEDAPIGTIDSFFARIVAPWRADLSERPTEDVVSDADRHVLIGRALEGLWRLRSGGDAIDAGVAGERAPHLVAARDRLARRFGSRRTMRKVLSALLSNRVFVDSVSRRLERNGAVDSADVHRLIDGLLSPADAGFDAFVDDLHTACSHWLDNARIHARDLDLVAGLSGDTRFSALVDLIDSGPPATRWERWLWVHALCVVTCSTSSHRGRRLAAWDRDLRQGEGCRCEGARQGFRIHGHGLVDLDCRPDLSADRAGAASSRRRALPNSASAGGFSVAAESSILPSSTRPTARIAHLRP